MIVQIQTSVGKVNVQIRDEFDKARIQKEVVRELKESKRYDWFKPIKVKGWRYDPR